MYGLPPGPAPATPIVAGAGPGGSPFVVAYNHEGISRFGFYAYDEDFRGGVRVATGDFNGDGIPDIVTAPGPGRQADIRLFSGVSGSQFGQFLAYDASMTAGVFVATGDVDGDGILDIITGAGNSAEPRVRVFSGLQLHLAPIRDFLAYPGYNVGVNVAAGDFNADGKADIVTGPELGNPHVKVFDGSDPSEPLIRQFFAYNPIYPVGATVAVGDFDADGTPDIVTGAGAPGGPHVKAFSGVDSALLLEFYAYDAAFTGGVRVATYDLNFDGRAEIITGAGPTNLNPPGTSNKVRAFNQFGFSTMDLSPFGSFLGGAYVG